MGRRWVTAALLPLCACGAQLGDDGATGDARNTGDGRLNQANDARSDGTSGLGMWSTPKVVPGADTTVDEDDVTLSRNELELYFKKPNGTNGTDLYVMTRASTTAAFGSPVAVTALNSTSSEESPRLADNDLTMYFGRGGDIYKGTRASVGSQAWTVSPVSTLNTANNEKWAAVCDSGYVIVSRANGAAGQDLYDGTITAGATNLLGQLDTNSNEQGTFLTTDCLGLYFQSNRVNALYDIYMSTRTSMTAAWSNPTALTDFNTATYGEEDAWISASQRTFAFASNASGNKDVYISTR